MKLQEAIEILKTHNKWRRGAEIPQGNPTLIGVAIDTVVNYIESTPQFNPKFHDIITNIESKINTKKK